MIQFILPVIIAIIYYDFCKIVTCKINVHSHSYSKPIVSRYIGINSRYIVYQCSCGERQIIKEYRQIDDPFPIKTTPFITHKELQQIANNKNITNLHNQ